ncbi:hypothetical protein MGAD_27510 [Mycolicibacterium gadium]|uniref:Uncharacterized protein n=1 Tax=Mycolicibacterium gadium TaxID=1794 RepID=A0A7I7WL81_MYCGU|nr:hypothetical protein MGAD_27510 [Mycolicibacterium gadium]
MLGQHRGDVSAVERSVVQILDIRAVDAEDVIDPHRREIRDDVVDNSMPCHIEDTNGYEIRFTPWLESQLLFEQHLAGIG